MENCSNSSAPVLAPTGGEDMLEIGLFVQWPDEAWPQLVEGLSKAKDAAQDEEAPEENEWITFGPFRAHVHPNGCQGKNGGYRWILEADGVKLLIGKDQTPHSSGLRQNVHAVVGSLPLMRDGALVMFETVARLIEQMGGLLTKDKVSRVDFALDMPGQSVKPFCLAHGEDRIVSRAEDISVHSKRRKFTGVSIGRGRIMACIYDKPAELMKTKDAAKYAVILEKRWHGQDQQEAARVEFRLRREALKEFKVESFKDWLDKRAQILAHMANKWLRITNAPVSDRKRGDLAQDCELWERVKRGFADVAGQALPAKRERSPKPECERLVEQASGCLITALACSEKLPKTPNQAKRRIVSLLSELIEEKPGNDLLDKIWARHDRLIASGYLPPEEEDEGREDGGVISITPPPNPFPSLEDGLRGMD